MIPQLSQLQQSLHRMCCCEFCTTEVYDSGKTYRQVEVVLSGFGTLECPGPFNGSFPSTYCFTAYTDLSGTYSAEAEPYTIFPPAVISNCLITGQHTVSAITRTHYDSAACTGGVLGTLTQTELYIVVWFTNTPTSDGNESWIGRVQIFVGGPSDPDRYSVFEYLRAGDSQNRYAGDTLTNQLGACNGLILFSANGTVVVNIV